MFAVITIEQYLFSPGVQVNTRAIIERLQPDIQRESYLEDVISEILAVFGRRPI